MAHKLENKIVSQRFSHKREALRPKGLALKPSRPWVQEVCRAGGNGDFTLAGHTQGLTHTRTQAKGAVFIEAWAKPTCWSWRDSWGSRVWLWLSLGIWTLWWRYGEVFSYMIVEEADILLGSSIPKPSPAQQPVGFSTWTPQAKQQGKNIVHQQTVCLRTSWTHHLL